MFLEGLKAGHNINLTLSHGHRPVLKGAEETLDKFAKKMRDLRSAGIILNVPSMRGVLLAMLIDDGHEDKISPHILPDAGEPTVMCMC